MDLQQEETGTLMANTIHTMSMRLRQTVTRDSGESKVGPELLPGVQGSWVVAGTCMFRKLPLAVEAASERFPLAAGATSAELLLERSQVGVVPFPDQGPALVLSVLLSRLPPSAAAVVLFSSARPPGSSVGLAVARPRSVEVDGGDVGFSGGILTGAADPALRSTASSLVGSSLVPCTSLVVMPCSLSLRPAAGSGCGLEPS